MGFSTQLIEYKVFAKSEKDSHLIFIPEKNRKVTKEIILGRFILNKFI